MTAPDRAVTGLLAGCLVFYLLLMALDGAGIPWSPLTLIPALGLAAFLAHRFTRWASSEAPARFPSDLGWGDAVALAALGVFALFSLTLWNAIPDFIYHWGIKGHRFYLERGIDFEYLARSWNWPIHPDYPNLLPILFAATAILGGGFREPVMMLWSTVWLAAMLLAAREVLRRWAPDRFVRQAALAVAALVLAGFGIGHLMAAAADWMIALALLAAVPALLAPPGRDGDFQIGCAAAFAAASKTEGLPLAALLVLVQFVRHLAFTRPGLSGLVRSALRLGLPVAAVALPWLAAVRHHGLFQDYNAGSFDWSRASLIFPALWDSVRGGAWHRLELGLALLPLLALDRRLRPLAAVASLQLAFYLYVYFSARVDVVFLVESSFPRLVLHLLPAILVGAAVAFPVKKETAGISAGRS
ncbi:MAG TPA: hypothetical protein VEL74_20355 [Thermoanaerobaculia bacterium]|nr:hypothetical protein [Thermoanaerobaculia bacterium]